MIIQTEKHTFEVELGCGDAARNLVKTLPRRLPCPAGATSFTAP